MDAKVLCCALPAREARGVLVLDMYTKPLSVALNLAIVPESIAKGSSGKNWC